MFSKQQLPIYLFLLITLLAVHCYTHQHTHSKLSPQTPLTYSSLIKLKHITTNYWLHSHQITISRAGALSVTAYREDDHGNYWQLLQEYDRPKQYTYQHPIKCGHTIMLYSSISDYYLRTDQTQFGMTTQLLPLVHGIKKNQIDHNVLWTIQCADKQIGQNLHFGDKIRLKHQTTGKYVSTDGSSFYTEANCGRGCQIVGQLELHALQNGHFSQNALFQIHPALAFNSTNNQPRQMQS